MPTWTKEVVDLSVAGNSLTIDSIKIDGTNIGHTDDTDLLALTNGSLAINGAVTGVTTLATSGNVTVGGNLSVTGTLDLNDQDAENVGNIRLDSLTNDAAGGIIFDSTWNITLDADNDGTVFFKDGGIQYLKIMESSTSTPSFYAGGGSTLALTLHHTTGNVTVAGDLTISGGNITNAITCDSTVTTTGLLTATAGVKLGNNIIYASDGAATITLNATNDNVTILGDLTISGGNITNAITCDDNLTAAGEVTLGTITDFTSKTTIYNSLTIEQQAGGPGAEPSLTLTNWDAGNTSSSEISSVLFKTSKSDTKDSYSVTDDTATLGRIAWYGDSGSEFSWAGQLQFVQSGTYNGNSTSGTAGIPSAIRQYAYGRLSDNKGVTPAVLSWGSHKTGNDANRANLIVDGVQSVVPAGACSQIAIKNGIAPSAINDYTCIGSKDIGSDSALELTQQEAIASEAVTSDRTLQVTINGAIYKILLDYVSGE